MKSVSIRELLSNSIQLAFFVLVRSQAKRVHYYCLFQCTNTLRHTHTPTRGRNKKEKQRHGSFKNRTKMVENLCPCEKQLTERRKKIKVLTYSQIVTIIYILFVRVLYVSPLSDNPQVLFAAEARKKLHFQPPTGQLLV